MANTWTDYGVERLLKIALHGDAVPTDAKVVLLSTMTGADADTILASGMTEVSSAGYGGPQTVLFNNTDLTYQDDETSGTGQARHDITIADKVFPASSGDITAVGAALVVTESSVDNVWAVFDFDGSVTVTNGGSLTLTECELRIAVS